MKTERDIHKSVNHLVGLLKEGIAEKQSSVKERIDLELGKYQIINKIGEGGMGLVYKAWDAQLERFVALKVMLTSRGYSRKAKTRFLKEAKLTAQLDHPGIVKVHSIESEEDTDFIVMDFIDGTSLDEKMKQTRFSTRKAVMLIQQIASAMDYAHKHGIVHRDLKPSNLLLNENEEAIITDFGLAKDIRSEKVLTKTGEVLGTPIYMSPEQAQGKRVGVTSDIYALGAILYELMCGIPVVTGGNTMEILLNIVDKDILPPRQVNPRIHRDIEAICMKALEKKTANRYQSAEDFSRDLNNFLSGDVVEATPYNLRRRIWKKTVKSRWKIAFVALIMLSFILTFSSQKYVQNKTLEKKITSWQQKLEKSIILDYKLLKKADSLLAKGQKIIKGRQKVDLTHIKNRQTFLDHDRLVFEQWQKFKIQMQELKSISENYNRYTADVKENSYLEKISLSIPRECVDYFQLQGGNYAKTILLYIQQKSSTLQAEAQKNFTNKNLELAKWQLEYAYQLDSGNSTARQTRLEIQNSIRDRLNETLETTLSIQDHQGLGSSSILQDLYTICLMDCSLASSYYQIGKIYYSLRAIEDAEIFYERALQRQETPFSLYYLSEVRFFKCRDIDGKEKRRNYYLRNFLPLVEKRNQLKNSGKYQNLSNTAKAQLQIITFYDTVIREESNDRVRRLNFFFCPSQTTRFSIQEEGEIKERYEKGIAIYKKLLWLLDESNNSALTWQINYLKGLIYMDLAVLEESHRDNQPYFAMALNKFLEAATRYEALSLHWNLSLYWKIAQIHFFLHNYEESAKYYSKVYKNMEIWLLNSNRLNGNYWLHLNNYIIALSNLGRLDEINSLLSNYVKLFEQLLKEVPNNSEKESYYKFRIQLLCAILASLNWTSGDEELSKKYFFAAEKLKDVEKPGLYGECYMYVILAVKYGELETANEVIPEILDYKEVKKFYPVMRVFANHMQQHSELLSHYDDLFLANPKFRKLPTHIEKLIQGFSRVNQAHFPQSFGLAFLKPQAMRIMEDKDLQKNLRQLPKSQRSLSILPVFFYLYLKQNVDISEKRLQKMKILSPPQLYKRANAFFRQGKIDKAYSDLQKALEDSGNNQTHFQMKYQYAMAICLGHSLKNNVQNKELMYQHLWLALAMGWKNLDYTKNDPAFAAVRKEKRFQRLMNNPPLGLENYSLKQIKRLMRSWSEEGNLAPMLMEIFQAKVQSY